ncbi:hypothetical protein [uncultured Tateyamaria sp.]|uniref:hypothetical protein n=1 Tax=uncultured Tateyamaria sp. TaxID=455651 RepID=UPI0026357879|nr:hypothetical protein [uncultured Tateyamaria sp.]
MNQVAKATRRLWKSAQLYIGFHTDQQGNVRNQPKAWPPKNANATIHSDPKVQEVFLEVRPEDRSTTRDVQIKLQPDKIVLRRDSDDIGWEGIVVEDDSVAIRVSGTRIRIKVDGAITRETDDDTTYIEADGSILKMTEYVEAMMSGDGVKLSRRTPDNIAAITEDGVVARSKDR